MTSRSSQFHEFLHPAEDGRIWWPLDIAIKLLAGFKPIETIRGTELKAFGSRSSSLERGLLGAVRKSHGLVNPPQTFTHGGAEFVQARSILNWYAGYLLETEADESPPHTLARAVADAESE